MQKRTESGIIPGPGRKAIRRRPQQETQGEAQESEEEDDHEQPEPPGLPSGEQSGTDRHNRATADEDGPVQNGIKKCHGRATTLRARQLCGSHVWRNTFNWF